MSKGVVVTDFGDLTRCAVPYGAYGTSEYTIEWA